MTPPTPAHEPAFASTDGVRSAAPLRHARQVTFEEPLALELGEALPGVTVTYETYGRLNTARDNAVLICHALSGDSHVAGHDADDAPGWWDVVVGPGRCIDTDRYFVICPNVLGGCRGTTGPGSTNPATGRPYGRDFPAITVGDMVEAHRRLIDHLGIERLHAVVGGSMGGHQAICWARRFPGRVRGAVLLAASPRLTSQALAFDVVGRNAITRDPHFHDGQYYDADTGPDVGLAIARMIGHLTYISREAMREKFDPTRYAPRDVATAFEKEFSVGSYLGYQGDKFVERFDANSYVTLSLAMDRYDLGDTAEALEAALANVRCRWLVVSFTSDWLFPPEQSRELVTALLRQGRQVSYCNVTSSCGHDAFLLGDDLDRYGELMRAFLVHLDGQAVPVRAAPAPSHPASIFHGRRLDYDRIVELISPAASVLDLGCGGGLLLDRLRQRGNERVVGVELDEGAILASVQRGLDVVHADLNRGLGAFEDGQFDVVVLSRTLQAVRDVEGILTEILRVGRRCIVSFPNFAYHRLRRMLAEHGRAPQAGLLDEPWYRTPNLRFFSIADFEDFCRARGVRMRKRIALDIEAGREVRDDEDPNRNADLAIFVLSR